MSILDQRNECPQCGRNLFNGVALKIRAKCKKCGSWLIIDSKEVRLEGVSPGKAA